MEWLAVILTPTLTLVGIWLKELYETKRQAKKLEAEGKIGFEESIHNCQNSHKADLEKIELNYKKEFEEVHNRLDEMSAQLVEIAKNDYKNITELCNLRQEVERHNKVIERVYECEKQISILDNREKVSENRLQDLERHEEQRVNDGK